MSDLPPGFVLDGAPQQGPVLGPPPKAPAPPTSLQVNADNRAARQLELAERRFQYQIERDAAKDTKPNGTAADPKVAAKIANLESLSKQINRVQSLFNESQRGVGIGSAVEYLPTQANNRFNSASAGLAEQGLAAFRVPGVGSQSDTELRQFVEANKPSSRDFDSANLERLRTLRLRVDETRASLGLPPAQWEGVQPEDEGLTGTVSYEGPNPANAPAPQPSPAVKPVPEDIDAILAKYGVQ